MKTTFYFAAAAALLMASTAAHAGGISFEVDGQKIHIEAPRNCNSLSCLSVTSNGEAISKKNTNPKANKSSDDADIAANAPPAAAPAAPAAPPAPPAPAVQAPPAPAAVASIAPPAAPPAAANKVLPAPAPAAESSRERVTGLPSIATSTVPAAPAPAPVASAAPPAPIANAAPTAPTAPSPVQQDVQQEAAAVTPVGIWQTEDNKGNVRIEQCGTNICGYGEHTNERILIDLKPSPDNSKWTGRIQNPKTGSNYDSIVSMKGPNLLKVKGCALGGLFCGGQAWKRVS